MDNKFSGIDITNIMVSYEYLLIRVNNTWVYISTDDLVKVLHGETFIIKMKRTRTWAIVK